MLKNSQKTLSKFTYRAYANIYQEIEYKQIIVAISKTNEINNWLLTF